MPKTIDNIQSKELTALDRCDQCPGQAFVAVTGITGELFFCGHHFNKIESNEVAYKKLQDFAYAINDQRDLISDKRAGL